jgi:hypothetical protein
MPRKHHSKRRRHRRSQRGGDWFGSSSTPSSSGSGSSSGSWFSGIGNKAKGLTSSISNWFGSSSSSPSASTASGYQPPQQPQYGPQGQYAGRKRRTRKLARNNKSKKR